MILADHLHDLISALGGLFVGIGAIITSLLSLRRVRSHANDECEQRIEEIKAAFRRGTEYERRRHK